MSELNEMAEAYRSMRTMADPADQASVLAQLESDHGVAAIREGLKRPGQAECEDCCCDIPADRRQALPSAIRCAPCQDIEDRKGVHRR